MDRTNNDLNKIRSDIHALGSMYIPNRPEDVGTARLETICKQAEEIIECCSRMMAAQNDQYRHTFPEPEILYYDDGALEMKSYGRIPPVPDPTSMQYDYAGLRKMLNTAVASFCQKNHIPKYAGFVHITFTQYYGEEESRMLDCDNMYIKPFLDAISRNLLADDGPEYCDVKLEGKRGEYTCLDILVEPIV